MPQDFSLQLVLEALLGAGALVPAQAKEILTREAQARQHVTRAAGTERYEISPVEVVAIFSLPQLDQDRIT